FVRELAIYGSEHAAKLLGQIAPLAKMSARRDYIYALGAFLETHDRAPEHDAEGNEISVGYGWEIKRQSREPISEETRAELLQIVTGFAEDNPRTDVASALVQVVAHMRGPEATAALHSLVAHSSHDVADDAARILRAWGEKVDTPIAPGPVRFQLFVNGEPVRKGTNVVWMVEFGDASSGRSAE